MLRFTAVAAFAAYFMAWANAEDIAATTIRAPGVVAPPVNEPPQQEATPSTVIRGPGQNPPQQTKDARPACQHFLHVPTHHDWADESTRAPYHLYSARRPGSYPMQPRHEDCDRDEGPPYHGDCDKGSDERPQDYDLQAQDDFSAETVG